MEGLGLGANPVSQRPSPEESPGRSGDNRKPGLSPLPALASWTGKIRRTSHVEEAAAPGRMGRLGTPLSFGCISVTLHRA